MQITYTNSISGQQHNHDKMTATFHRAILFTIKSIFNDLKVNSDNYDKHIVPNINIDIKYLPYGSVINSTKVSVIQSATVNINFSSLPIPLSGFQDESNTIPDFDMEYRYMSLSDDPEVLDQESIKDTIFNNIQVIYNSEYSTPKVIVKMNDTVICDVPYNDNSNFSKWVQLKTYLNLYQSVQHCNFHLNN